MNNPMVLWYALVGILLLSVIANLMCYLHSQADEGGKRGSFFSHLKDRDIFYVPGDRLNDDEDDEFEDL